MLLEARLRAFIAVAEEGSFVGAAERLRLSQPAVSKHIAALEREVGVALVRRRPSVALTPPGRFLAEYVTRAGALLEQADRGVRALVEAEAGTLRLGASGTPGTYFVPDVVRRFVDERPFVEVDFRLGTSAEMVAALRNHEIDIAVVGGLATSEELTVEPLFDDRLVLIGAPALALGRLWPTDLNRLLWVQREEGSATRVALEAALHAIGVAPRRRLALPSWEAIKLVVAHGDAVAAISRLAIRVEQTAGTLTELAVKGWRLGRPISIATHPDTPLSPIAATFAAQLRRTSNQLAASE
jgi:DNA-binding transcriptional LysR family regulator